MSIICFNENLIIPYVPRYGKNRESKNQAIVGIKPLNNNGSIAFTQLLQNKLAKCSDDAESDEVSKAVARQTFIDHVKKVDGFEYMNEKNELTEIKTAAELYDNGPRGLINEISLAVENSSVLSEGQLKN